MPIDLTVQERRRIREQAALRDDHVVTPNLQGWSRDPVVTEPGDSPPRREGSTYYWTTPSGKTIVRHPNAYRWPTWYHPSTCCHVVGEEWVQELRRPAAELALCEGLSALQTASEAVRNAEENWKLWGSFDRVDWGRQAAAALGEFLAAAGRVRWGSRLDGAPLRIVRQPVATGEGSRFKPRDYVPGVLDLPVPEPRPRVDRGDGVFIEIDEDDDRVKIEREPSWRAFTGK